MVTMLVLFATHAAAQQLTTIKAGRLVDVEAGMILNDQVILIRDARIAGAGKALPNPFRFDRD
jgi:hypothetical protein